MSAPLLNPLVLGLLIALAQAAQQDSGIVNGQEAKPHSRPYMVSVQRENRHRCGGFLVSNSFVMTAAHCLTWGEHLTVLLGAHDITENQNSIRAEVKLYHIHPGYDALENDIMLLQLKTAVQKSKVVQWIPLPKKDKDTKTKNLCSVAGWGFTKTNGPSSPRLREVNVSVMSRAVCQKMWGSKPITHGMICAWGSNYGGFCQGDSGGPLVCKDEAVGIVSFTEAGNCDTPKKPNVYTQISKYLPWVKCIISSIK